MVKWRPVVGAEDMYEVSSDGRVRTVPRILKSVDHSRGYKRVTIKGQRRYIHRIVAEAFIDSDQTRPWVNHKNGCRSDNRAENLEWVTPGENIAHGYRSNGRKHRLSRPVVKLSPSGEVLAEFPSAAAASRAVGKSRTRVNGAIRRGGICAGYRWAFA